MKFPFDRWGRAQRAAASEQGAAARRPFAFTTDIRRTITGNLKRFISLFIITALGATMLVGLKAACDDLRATADAYYDNQRLFDISVKSTLGLDQDDIKALSRLDGVDEAEGSYTETAYTEVDGTNEKVDLKALLAKGLNEPLIVDGRLPRDVGEIAVTRQYLDKSGKKLGDKVTFESMGEGADGADDASDALNEETETSSEIFTRRSYTITGVVLDPMDVNNGESLSFRSTNGSKYAFFLTLGAVENHDTFTVAYLTVDGAAALPTYSDEYDELIDRVKQEAEGIRGELEDARTDGVKADANATIDEKEADANARLNDAQAQLDDAQGQIDDALAQIAAGKLELDAQGKSAQEQLSAAQAEIDANRAKVKSGLETIDQQQAELDAGRTQAQGALDKIAQAEAGAQTLKQQMGSAWPEDAWRRLLAGDKSAKDTFVGAVARYAQQAAEQLRQITDLCAQVEAALGKLAKAGEGEQAAAIRVELIKALKELSARLAEVPGLEAYRQQIDQAITTLSDGCAHPTPQRCNRSRRQSPRCARGSRAKPSSLRA